MPATTPTHGTPVACGAKHNLRSILISFSLVYAKKPVYSKDSRKLGCNARQSEKIAFHTGKWKYRARFRKWYERKISAPVSYDFVGVNRRDAGGNGHGLSTRILHEKAPWCSNRSSQCHRCTGNSQLQDRHRHNPRRRHRCSCCSRTLVVQLWEVVW